MFNQQPVSYRWVVVISAIFLIGSSAFYVNSFRNKGHSKVVYCDVGQGDGVYIRTPEGVDIIIDAGYDNKMLTCLGRHMLFFDKTIEYAFLSHPQHDHYAGFLGVLKNYEIVRFYHSSGDNVAKSYTLLKKLLQEQQVEVRKIHSHTLLQLDRASTVELLWPPADFQSSDLNDHSQIIILRMDDKKYLFTGDTSPFVQSIVSEEYIWELTDIFVLKVPHHGSKNGLTQDFLILADPPFSVISVAAKNRYHHPSKQVLDFFKATGKTYLTTALAGDIVFEDGSIVRPKVE